MDCVNQCLPRITTNPGMTLVSFHTKASRLQSHVIDSDVVYIANDPGDILLIQLTDL